jgi:hypothetical protein
LNGSELQEKTDVASGETLSFDVTSGTMPDNTYNFTATAIDGGVQVAEIEGQFTTYVLEAQIQEPNNALADLEYNLYHANSDASFNFGSGEYEKVLTTTDPTAKLALSDFGTGADDCFKVTSQNLEGESLEAHPLLGDGGECAGSLIP